MHTCEPPFATTEAWLESYPSVEGNYGHLLLEQKIALTPELVDGLRPYFESAHLDAREHFALSPNLGPPGARIPGLFHGGGPDAPPWSVSDIGTLYPIALWGRSSL
ncbi:MAG: hypothetical protein AAGE18_16145, partial [Pseudomonadota bacterium]